MLKACACAGEQGSRGAGEQGSRGEFNVPCSFPSAPLHFKLVRNAGEALFLQIWDFFANCK
ncbi:MAG: hypothetical protein V7L23_27735 [Nostoc sp.]|uniref:hypothetical protein n=1 Tax=Nostoc sp. TaxID=1180 RepID=UPI002FF350C1